MKEKLLHLLAGGWSRERVRQGGGGLTATCLNFLSRVEREDRERERERKRKRGKARRPSPRYPGDPDSCVRGVDFLLFSSIFVFSAGSFYGYQVPCVIYLFLVLTFLKDPLPTPHVGHRHAGGAEAAAESGASRVAGRILSSLFSTNDRCNLIHKVVYKMFSTYEHYMWTIQPILCQNAFKNSLASKRENECVLPVPRRMSASAGTHTTTTRVRCD